MHKFANAGKSYQPKHPGNPLAEALEGENAELKERIAEIIAMNEELEAKVLRVVRGNFAQICGYCGWESADGGWEELQAHIKTCPNHPVTMLTQQLDELARENIAYRDHKWDEVRRQTVTEIIDLIAGGSFLHVQAPDKLFADRIIAAINRKYALEI